MRRFVNLCLLLCVLAIGMCGCQVIHIHVGDTAAQVEASDMLNPSVRIPLPIPQLPEAANEVSGD